MKTQFTFLILITILLGCTESTPPSKDTLNKQKEEVKTTLTAMWDAIEKKDIKLNLIIHFYN